MCNKFLLFFILLTSNLIKAQIMLPAYQPIQYVNSTYDQYPAGTVFCNGAPTEIVDVVSPTTGRIWMDRDLGAPAFGSATTDVYQWGRGSDGHQCYNSPTTTILSTTDQPGNNKWIQSDWTIYQDWRTPLNDNLWQGINGVNNPCPLGYRLPTISEANAEIYGFNFPLNSSSPQNSFLQMKNHPIRGGNISSGYSSSMTGFWTSTPRIISVNTHTSYYFSGTTINYESKIRNNGDAVRCLKN